jgi:hypothetical protein
MKTKIQVEARKKGLHKGDEDQYQIDYKNRLILAAF